jgi:hypothetical protein
MIALSLLIALLASCGYLVGAPILARLSRGSGLEWGADGAFLSIWLGVVILADALLAVSLAAPLSPPVAAGVFVALFLVSLFAGGGRKGVPFPHSRASAAAVLGTVILILGVSAYCSQVIVYYDTRLYHMQSIKWLSHYGLVPGEALIHERLAYISAWFAPAAAFDHGVIEGRAASAGGAFALFMLVAHLLVALRRIARGEGRPTDSFLAAAAIPTLAVTLLFGLPNSASPDLPVFVLVIEGALAMLLVSARGHEEEPGTTPWHARLIPVIIGAGATALKLSALPLLALALFYYARPQPTLKKVAAAGAAVALFLLPVAAAGIVTSGCAFYPAPYICLDLPWSLGSAQAAAESLLIRDWARWDGLTPPAPPPGTGYPRGWPGRRGAAPCSS